MFNDTIMESLVALRPFLCLWRKDIQVLESSTIDFLQFRPPNELIRDEALEEFPFTI